MVPMLTMSILTIMTMVIMIIRMMPEYLIWNVSSWRLFDIQGGKIILMRVPNKDKDGVPNKDGGPREALGQCILRVRMRVLLVRCIAAATGTLVIITLC